MTLVKHTKRAYVWRVEVTSMLAPSVCGDRVRSSEFTWCPDERVFAAEVSDFGHAVSLFRPLYAGEAAVGFVLVSAKTGDEAEFMLKHAERSGDGEVTSWTFCPTGRAARRFPALVGVRVRVFND